MFKVITKGCELTRGSKYSACVDLRASQDVVIGAGETKMIRLGVKIDLEKVWDIIIGSADKDEDYNKVQKERFLESHYLQLMLRSSLGKKGLILPNGVGVIDLDYPYEIKLIVHNPIKVFEINRRIINTHSDFKDSEHIESDQEYKIKKGDRIAQITLLEHKSYLFGIDTETKRNGGIGSTDEK